MTGEEPKPDPKATVLVRWSIGADGKPKREWMPEFMASGNHDGWAVEGSPEEIKMKKEVENGLGI